MASKPETPATEPKEKPKIGRRPDPKPEASPEQSLDNKKAPESKSTLKDLPASTEDSTNVDKGNASGWKRGVAPPNKDPGTSFNRPLEIISAEVQKQTDQHHLRSLAKGKKSHRRRHRHQLKIALLRS